MEDIEDFVVFFNNKEDQKCQQDNADLVPGKKQSTGEFATSYKT
jgi:hypothetical protein